MLKLIIKLLCRRGDYIRPVKVGDEIYIIKIEKFVSNEEEMERWKRSLKDASEEVFNKFVPEDSDGIYSSHSGVCTQNKV